MRHAQSPRRLVLRRLAAAALFGVPGMRRAAAQPAAATRLRLIAPAPPGSTPDLVVRRYAERMAERRPSLEHVIVDNRPGGAGLVAIAALRQAPPDGGTLAFLHLGVLTRHPQLYRRLPYDPAADLVPVSLAAHWAFALAVGPAVPQAVRTVPQCIAWARGADSPPACAVLAVGSMAHLLGTMLVRDAGVALQHIPYVSGQQSMVDLLAGRVAAVILPAGLLHPYHAAGTVRVLVVFAARRSPLLPEVPNAEEAGFPRLVRPEVFGWFAPRGTPDAIVQTQAALARDAAPGLTAGLVEIGVEPLSSSPAEIAERITVETRFWAGEITASGIHLD